MNQLPARKPAVFELVEQSGNDMFHGILREPAPVTLVAEPYIKE